MGACQRCEKSACNLIVVKELVRGVPHPYYRVGESILLCPNCHEKVMRLLRLFVSPKKGTDCG